MDLAQIVREIQYVLAPAVMISSSALLLLGFQNKFSNLVNRFRALNQERRLLHHRTDKNPRETERLANLESQLGYLLARVRHVKNAILLTHAAIIAFTTTSILLFWKLYTSFPLFFLIIGSFLLGLVLVLASSLLVMIEVALAYKIVMLERQT